MIVLVLLMSFCKQMVDDLHNSCRFSLFSLFLSCLGSYSLHLVCWKTKSFTSSLTAWRILPVWLVWIDVMTTILSCMQERWSFVLVFYSFILYVTSLIKSKFLNVFRFLVLILFFVGFLLLFSTTTSLPLADYRILSRGGPRNST